MLMYEGGVVNITQHFKSSTKMLLVSVAQLVNAFVGCIQFYNWKDTYSNLTRNP